MISMFYNCSKLTTLDLTGFYASTSRDVLDMFANTALSSVILGENTDAVVKGAMPNPSTTTVIDPATGATSSGNWVNNENTSYDSLASAPAGTYKVEVDAATRLDLTSATVSFEIAPTETAYTGAEIKPTVTVINTATNTTLIEGPTTK